MEALSSTGLVILAFIALILLRLPVIFAIMVAVCLYFIGSGLPAGNIAVRMTGAIDSSVLIAIPLYLIAGEFMNISGATRRLIAAAQACLSWLKGGLAQTNIFSSLIFAGMSGSALADSAGIGKVMIPSMKDRGYDPAFSAAVTAASSTVGPIFPPSIPMIVYGAITGTSVGALFLAGVIPGIAMTVALMVWTHLATRSMPLKGAVERPSPGRILAALADAALPLATPAIILSGIFFGFMTPTEAGAVAALYAAGLGLFVYQTANLRDLFDGITRAMIQAAAVMMLLGIAAVLGWIITLEGVAAGLGELLGGNAANFIVVMLVINMSLLVIGMFMDSTAAMLVFVPVFAPIALDLGVSPVQFGVIVVMNLMIGVITPPVGFCLFVTASIAETPVRSVIRAALPFLIPLLAMLAAVIAVPAMTLWLAQAV
ncbi:MAG: TRAP transporter large permease [Azospirillaceae bacterium]